MNIRKSTDYSAMFAALDALMAANLPQMELYRGIGHVVSGRPEKGAAVAAAEYLQGAYPDATGFSPRSLRRMRDFYRTYDSTPEVMSEAMTIGWTQNVVITEAELTSQEKAWYIRAVRQFGWSKSELAEQIAAAAHLEIALDLPGEMCYTKENSSLKRGNNDGDSLQPGGRVCDEERGLSGCAVNDWRTTEAMDQPSFHTNVVTGPALLALSENVRSWRKRDCYRQLDAYLHNSECDRVCLLFGLRRTGKTTLLRQAVLDMTPEDAARTAYIKATMADTMAALNRDMEQLRVLGFRYVLLDEVTLMRDFIDSAALLSDVYAAQGMKIVLSGTDSLGFWFTLDQELYDRAKAIHTTFIPFREHSRLLGISGIDEYIRYGGTLRAGELAFEDAEVNAEDASFRDDESTRRYIDTAICKNIQHSLACCEDGGHFRHLRTLYEAGELTGAINRIIEDMNHAFLVSVLTRDFQSQDLGLAARNLRKERDPEKRTNILDEIDTDTVTRRLMDILNIRNRREQTVPITETHVAEIKEYLRALELITDCPIETAQPGSEPVEHILFTQPGMRYCQAQALVHSLMKDDLFLTLSEREKDVISGRILEEVRGRMLEDIVLLETSKALGNRYKVCKLQFASGEFDMVVYDRQENCCAAFEIKHSSQVVPEQARHLRDPEKCALTQQRFGELAGRYVLYLGEAFDIEDGIVYQNVEQFLKALPEFSLRADMVQTVESDQINGQGFRQTM